jgi:hypothetical protein
MSDTKSSIMTVATTNAEAARLAEAREATSPWRHWGPYLSERQWGTVREDYSADGNAWDYFSHDQARSRAYRWGEDGIAGISDSRQRLCFALALWNGKDPILKERLFGLTNREGNHGEDVKECYFYLDSTPTHSYMKMLYKYPQSAYPYDDLVKTNRERKRHEPEYELADTGVFDENRYFDVFVEYAKESPEDILVCIHVHNRGPDAAEIHLLPTLWFRNRWSSERNVKRAALCAETAPRAANVVVRATEPDLGERFLYCDGRPTLLFTENESNNERLFKSENPTRFVKDGIHEHVVHGRTDTVNPESRGTKASAWYRITVPAGKSETVRLRLTTTAPSLAQKTYVERDGAFGRHFDDVMDARRREADEFYSSVIPRSLDADHRNVMRQALAGMLWSKQFYYFDVNRWLQERGCGPYRSSKRAPRNEHWHHMHNADVISMPDKWEYPWYAAWDLAFHALPLTLVDTDFGKHQLDLMLRDNYLHPNGQMPAYEWNFGDVNPPVHAWATLFTYRLDRERSGKPDVDWLERCFQKLLLNFTWWLNRKDRAGKNAFEGGFLGLDNIGVFDRSAPLPTGGYLEQADGTAWMALFSLNMLEMAGELALHNAQYADMLLKFVHHFVSIASATIHAGGDTSMWDEEDGFFYDVLRLPNGEAQRLKVRSMVGLLPLCAVAVFEDQLSRRFPEVAARLQTVLEARPELVSFIHDPTKPGHANRRLGAILDETKLRRVLTRMLDENEFLSAYGIRSLSRVHAEHPYVLRVGEQEFRVPYLSGESDSGMFGGNSNWRGPIWMPVNALIIRALLQYYAYYGDEFTIECPTGSGRRMNLYRVAEEISRRISSIFLADRDGRRPVNGRAQKLEQDPHWRDYLQFFEYFDGETGAGLGANHQTGWTGVVARGMHLFATTTPEQMLALGKLAAVVEIDDRPKSHRAASASSR